MINTAERKKFAQIFFPVSREGADKQRNRSKNQQSRFDKFSRRPENVYHGIYQTGQIGKRRHQSYKPAHRQNRHTDNSDKPRMKRSHGQHKKQAAHNHTYRRIGNQGHRPAGVIVIVNIGKSKALYFRPQQNGSPPQKQAKQRSEKEIEARHLDNPVFIPMKTQQSIIYEAQQRNNAGNKQKILSGN